MKYDKWMKDWKTALAENFFLRSTVLLLAIGLILNASVFRKKERIVVAPPQVAKTFWIEADQASPEYIEQMSTFFSTLAGNLSPTNADYVANAIAGYLSPKRYAEVKADLYSQAAYIKKNNVQQSFFPTQVTTEGTKATVTGTVDRYVGSTRISHENMIYHLTYRMDSYKILLEEFWVDYPDRKNREQTAAEPPAPDGKRTERR